jgi:hypothetical protein
MPAAGNVGGAAGGVVRTEASAVTLQGCLFDGNVGGASSGALLVVGGSLTVSDTL